MFQVFALELPPEALMKVMFLNLGFVFAQLNCESRDRSLPGWLQSNCLRREWNWVPARRQDPSAAHRSAHLQSPEAVTAADLSKLGQLGFHVGLRRTNIGVVSPANCLVF